VNTNTINLLRVIKRSLLATAAIQSPSENSMPET
jgi:hypothetical protein